MELLPISTASLGAMGSLAGKLGALQDSKLKKGISKLGTRLLQLSKARDPPHTARRWMEDVRQLSYDMENCVDAEADWIMKMPRMFKVRVKEANKRYDKYKLETVPIPTDVFPIIQHRLPTVDGSRQIDPVVVGLHDEGGAVDTLRQWLKDDGMKELKVVSIVGAGGIGKTTLAKQLWRDNKLGEFHCRAFVRTAKIPDTRRILRSILAQVRPHQPPDSNEVHELIHDLKEHLRDKRYFLIIDDLWATSVWDVARRAFPEGKGSRILTTTEIEDVALACCGYHSNYIFQMVPLSHNHSKELFTGAAFCSREQYSPQLTEVLDKIIRRCAGLPQAIICISSVLASQGEEDTVQNMEKILNNLPTNTTNDDILKQVLNFCYNCLPSSLQTCLLYLILYPVNYMVLKEDIVKQWAAEGFILAATEKDKMKVAGSYFDKLVSMGLIQHIDVDYTDDVLYYAVSHTVHHLIAYKATEQNFITVMDYSRRTARFSNKVSRLSLQFGSATYVTKTAIMGLPQVRSLAFIGLNSCFPPVLEFTALRSLILHVWADQPSTGVDLKPTSQLVLLRSMQVTCNDTVHLPDLMQGPKHLEILEINAIVEAIPANIVHLRSWLHLRLGVGTELPDVTGILNNMSLNHPISLDESSSPPNSVTTIELLPPICSIPKWIGHLTKLCSLKVVVKELDDTSNLQGLPSLTVLSLHVQRGTTEGTCFATGAFSALEHFEFKCDVLRLIFEKGTMPNLQRLKLGFNARRGEQSGPSLTGIEHLKNVSKIVGIIGVPAGADESDLKIADSEFKKAIGMHRYISVKRRDMVKEEWGPPEEQQSVIPSTSSELAGSLEQESQEENRHPDKQHSVQEKHQATSSEQPVSQEQKSQELDNPPNKQHSVQEKQQATSSELPVSPKQETQEDISQNADRDSLFIDSTGTSGSSGMGEYRQWPSAGVDVGGRVLDAPKLRVFTLAELRAVTRGFKPEMVLGEGGFGRVYKGWADERSLNPAKSSAGVVVAVKKLNHESVQGLQEWQSEVNFLGRLQHPNLVKLLGYCGEDRELLLVYEFMPKGSLEHHLFRRGASFEPLPWETRLKIAIGAARGLAFLHSPETQIIYRDFKASNILLDANYGPKLSDFGLAKSGPSAGQSHVTTRIIGTYGYDPPEYVATGHMYVKSDVYGFGVVLLELLTGLRAHDTNRPSHQVNLVEWARPYIATGGKKLTGLMDQRLAGQYPPKAAVRAARLAHNCLCGDPKSRPSMDEVLAKLEEIDVGVDPIFRRSRRVLPAITTQQNSSG